MFSLVKLIVLCRIRCHRRRVCLNAERSGGGGGGGGERGEYSYELQNCKGGWVCFVGVLRYRSLHLIQLIKPSRVLDGLWFE